MALTQEQIREAKLRGFLRNRGTDRFSARVVVPGGVYTPEQLERIACCARACGGGRVAFTARQSAEIVGIPYEEIHRAVEMIEEGESGLVVGGTGPRVRPVTACKGTTCVFGLGDTQAVAAALHRRFYLGQGDAKLPGKLKIAVGGCPNSCAKPNLNDIGLEACRRGGESRYRVFVGGAWGKKTRVGDELSRTAGPREVEALLEGILGWYTREAGPGERLCGVVERLGVDRLEAALYGEA